MKAVFIAGTDTAVGKTIITGLFGRYLLSKGYSVITQKWIQTGSKNFPVDIKEHLRLMGKKKNYVRDYLPYVAPYNFKLASSPHLAANIEKIKINANQIKNSFRFLSKKFNFVIVEGIGGALVPINNKRLLIDIVRELDLPVLIVARNRLGSINHTLLTIEALKARNLKILGIIFNNMDKKEQKVILSDNVRIVKSLTKETILGDLPGLSNQELLYKAFISIGDRIFSKLTTEE